MAVMPTNYYKINPLLRMKDLNANWLYLIYDSSYGLAGSKTICMIKIICLDSCNWVYGINYC